MIFQIAALAAVIALLCRVQYRWVVRKRVRARLYRHCFTQPKKEVAIVKDIFGILIGADEEANQETLHELGCGCPECTGHDSEGG